MFQTHHVDVASPVTVQAHDMTSSYYVRQVNKSTYFCVAACLPTYWPPCQVTNLAVKAESYTTLNHSS